MSITTEKPSTRRTPSRSTTSKAEARVPRILVIDNYDSFVYNLVQYLGQLGAEVDVVRNDVLTVTDLSDGTHAGAPVDGILLSPGPGAPKDAGICLELVQAAASGGLRRSVPIFGVCLGHQAIGAAFGATVGRAPELLHGKTSEVHHDEVGVFAGLPRPFIATRYHSLAVELATIPAELAVTGRTESGVVMGLRHQSLPIEGVQFHPESVLTQAGHLMLANWLAMCGFPSAIARATPLVAQVEQRRRAAFEPGLAP